MIPFPRHDEDARVKLFWRDVHEAMRRGVVSVTDMRRNVGRLWSWHAEQFLDYRRERRAPLILRSAAWEEPRRSEVVTQWDDYDRAQHAINHALVRQRMQEEADACRWAQWILSHLNKTDVIDEIQTDTTQYLHWDWIGWSQKCPVLLTSNQHVVAMIRHEPAKVGPTFRAVIFTPGHWPQFRVGSTVLNEAPQVLSDGDTQELTWCMFRQRKGAFSWLQKELGKRQYSMTNGAGMDIPEMHF